MCIDRTLPFALSLEAFACEGKGVLEPLPIDLDRVSTIFATGGTTGYSKGAVWTDRAWQALIDTFRTVSPSCDAIVHLAVGPMTHAAGVLALMMMGQRVTHIVLPKPDPEAILSAIEQYRVTHLYLPPTLLYMLLSHPRVREYDYSSLVSFIVAAAPIAPEKLKEAVNIFGPVMTQAYGQAEAPFLCTYFSRDEIAAAAVGNCDRRLLACGRATPAMEVAIADEEGNFLTDEEQGEIIVRGPLLMREYYRNPVATAEITLPDGWRRTGDIGRRSSDGLFYIVDRKKDMIISGGFNVFAAEVEHVLLAHPSIQDCAVIGVPDEKWGEAVKACIELKPDASVDPEEVIDFCKARIGSVLAPKSVEIWPELPRSGAGKILKRSIRERYWQNADRKI